MWTPTQRRTMIVLTGISAALAYLIAVQLGSTSAGISETVIVAATQSRRVAKLSEGVSLPPPLDQLRETVSRPLFLASRRAPRPATAPTARQSTVERGKYGLVGVMLFDGRRQALIKSRGEERVLRVTEGQRIDRWRVAKINAHRVLLSQGDLQEELRLVDAASPHAPVRPAPVKVPDAKEAGESAQSPAS